MFKQSSDTPPLLKNYFNIDSVSVIERFVTIIEPEILDNYIKVRKVKLIFDSKICNVKLSTREYTIPRPETALVTAYLIDFELVPEIESISFKFEV